MKIMQINSMFNEGSTGKITKEMHEAVKKFGYESVVLYGRGKKTKEKNVYKVCSNIYGKVNKAISMFTGIMYGGCFLSTNRIKRYVKNENPDIVHLQCINGYFCNIFRIVEFLKKRKTPVVLTLHAEFMYTANCGHSVDCEKWKTGCGKCPRLRKETKSIWLDRTNYSYRKMLSAFKDFDNLMIVSVSPWLKERAITAPILFDKQHSVILNGINTNIFYPREERKKKLKAADNKKVILHVTAGFVESEGHIKGGQYVTELAKEMIGLPVVFLVAGPYNVNCKLPSNMVMLGRIENQEELAELYSIADVTLLTSKRETFSMVCAESLCCGTPVVGFKAGGPESIAIKEASSFVEYGNIDALKKELSYAIYKNYNRSNIANIAQQKYNLESTVNEYITLYENFYKGMNTNE